MRVSSGVAIALAPLLLAAVVTRGEGQVPGRTPADSARIANMICSRMDSLMGGCKRQPTPPAAPGTVMPSIVILQALAKDTAGKEGWVALPAGKFYYRAGCQAAQEFPNPVWFRTATDAEASGLRRSRVLGC